MNDIRVDPDDWDSALADTDGPQLVVAGPGAGKTEFLVRRARHLISSGVAPEEILLLSFSRRGAADLRARVAAGMDRSFTVIPASTFHALALRIVESHGAAGDWPTTPTLLTGPEQVALVADLLASEGPADWPMPYRSLLSTGAFADEVTDFILRASERLIGSDQLAAMDRADWRRLPGFLDRYRAELVARGRIDYGSLQVEAIALLDDPAVAAEVAGAFRYVLVDEYQDTTVAQARIVESMAAGHRNLTAAGDPYQSVYSFRGAEVSNIAEFPERFPDTTGTPAKRLVLTTSFRVPRAILDAAVRLTAGAGLPGSAGPVLPAPGDGSVESYGFDQQSAEAEWIADEVQRVHLRDGIPYRRMGVLVRSKRGVLPELSRALDRRSIPHRRPDTRLADHRAVRPILDLVAAAAGSDRDVALRRVLMGPIVAATLAAAREIERRAHTAGWSVALAEAGERDIAGLLDNATWAVSAPAARGFWHLWTLLPGLGRMAMSDAGDRAALASFAQALDRLAERDPEATLADHLAVVRAEDFEAQPLISYRSTDTDHVTLTTLHQAKGHEFDLVFIADAREGVFPDLRSRDSLLGTRHLAPSHGTDDRAYARFRLQEERRLAYTAMCRARTRVVWTCTVAQPDEQGGAPSRFLPLVTGLSMEEATRRPGATGRPTTPREAEAWLRRQVADPTLPVAERLGALAVLVEEDSWHPRPATEFAGILSRGPDTGLIGDHPTLSPSQADSFAQCPRRYAFERRLRISGGSSVYADFGGLIHAVLEEVERNAVAAGADHGTFEAARAELDARFEPAQFGGTPWSDAWHARAVLTLDHLYRYWPGQGPAIAFEEEVRYEVDGIPWVGRVDRAERRENGIHIVDYKTSGSAPSVDETKAATQLGFYVLARSGVGDAPVAGAEFWYPRVEAGKRKSVATRRFDMAYLADVRTAMVDIQSRILAEQWVTNPGDHCDRCPVRIVCPEWPEGEEAFA